MKESVFKFGVLILTFVIGIGIVWLVSFNFQKQSHEVFVIENNFCQKDFSLKQKEGIEIKFLNFVEKKYGLSAEFEMTNHSANTYNYSAYVDLYDSVNPFISPQIKLNGKKIDQFVCGMGLDVYQLKPGETKRFETQALSHYWTKGQSMQIGVSLKEKNQQNFDYQIYWSEDLPITETIGRKLLEEKKLSISNNIKLN